ncbi:DUF1168-domain-containing protein [Hesseltinella vesiculosa]|uniref:DUF1168-domain-containing protein n=1 Tax=Hesseltinella vesiculosa TaxID=101127 RepID=A0A1X2GQS3_9FUNG|nr:DUF1168-domain-containing protein [Hesseltinella vesiculosa]
MSENEKTKENTDEKPKEWVPPSVRHNMTETEKRQRQLDRMFENIDKPVVIPDRPTGPKEHKSKDFVRNVSGSSAGAGSGDFHVYRAIRRREYARLNSMAAAEYNEKLDQQYEEKIERMKQKDDDKTAKKRARRQKRKQSKQQNEPAKKAKTEVNPT